MFGGDGDGLESEQGLTPYELERIAHIRRNRAIMARLGGAVQVDPPGFSQLTPRPPPRLLYSALETKI